eukprot:gene9589-6742_t
MAICLGNSYHNSFLPSFAPFVNDDFSHRWQMLLSITSEWYVKRALTPLFVLHCVDIGVEINNTSKNNSNNNTKKVYNNLFIQDKEVCILKSVGLTNVVLYLFFENKTRAFYCCQQCNLIFVPQKYFLSEAEEKAEYDLHQNNSEDEGYRRFLMRAAQPVLDRFKDQDSEINGLDYGCGPCPVLASIFSTSLHCKMEIYDLFYFPDEGVLTRQYDFITLTEVVEHLENPLRVLVRLWRLLKPGGSLVIMTKRAAGTVDAFRNWHYIRDLTHITFFADRSFEWIREYLETEYGDCLRLVFHSSDVVLLAQLKENKSNRVITVLSRFALQAVFSPVFAVCKNRATRQIKAGATFVSSGHSIRYLPVHGVGSPDSLHTHTQKLKSFLRCDEIQSVPFYLRATTEQARNLSALSA